MMMSLRAAPLLPFIVTCVVTLTHTTSLTAEAKESTQEPLESTSEPFKPDALTLGGLLSCVRSHNPASEVARAELRAARAKLSFATASALPSMKVSGLLAPLPARRMLDYCVSTEDNRSVVVCPNQKIADDQRLDQIDGMGVLGRVTLTVTQPLYTFGKITHGKAAARAGVDAYEAGLARASQSADLLAVETFYGLQLGAQVKKALKRANSNLKKFKRRVEKDLKVEGGNYTSNDLHRLTIQEAELKARGFEVDALVRQAEQGVRVSCEVDPEAKISLESSRLKALDHPLETQEALWEHARAHRLDIKMAQAQVLARQALLSKATADLLPDLGLVGALTYSKGTSAEDNPDPFANDPFNVFGYGVYLGLNWSLGAAELMSSREEAHAALDKALAQLKGAEQLARLALIEAHEQAKRRQAELSTRKGAMRAAKKWMNSTFMNLNMGIVKSKQAAQSLSAYLQASVAYDQATYEYNLALTRLWRAAGVDLTTRLR